MKTHRVKAHERRSPSKPAAYAQTHDWLRVDVAMDAWSREFLEECESLIRAHALPERMELSDTMRETF